ncbi:hypothetical protein TVAG_499440 [Trichomonas vaginalis G3]|uniref:Uncharacterized protein n=1 Tax=Trichomonas vaginalis (strain ATCC PRA-98 / G3) TaxID=412133 RepID=A2EIN1_TRIV3|nr:hypothetical protein TVAGG3_0960150 [Trichomonas vaginalis G3]EAY07458.1 hypothetical protein TVAG_499440 [Trichomonas vaginalis G3]KAI5487846.1 hypothetical protein TVAGG3_0960150 [Trichomonas vaginalis G3]|eukprot:XP_001319681.1 hypothetical protein [Trichomonas vaginalis G3]
MNRSDAEVAELMAWRREHHLCADREATAGITMEYIEREPKNFHFFNYDPTLGPTDLSNVSLKRDENQDTAVFSIPLSFTESSKTKYISHGRSELGLDLQSVLTPHNGTIYPLVK